MHLKQLKLAGFKSFVDPTVVYFPSQLVAVVGPNGCGKSNIIDAVRWVMGESSAKNLRGDSMIDVIFNGSSNRKPVGQASVELIFDNSLGRLVGPFASYGEIAVKRIVTRDGESNYYLNGSRCRRRDVTDIFLGTGAGARGYSIIGQGTVSRLIEAKPEELRVFLEEAAGVSKYKERRRETLQRIAHTQENLSRVADIRAELDKQLQRLERQAKAAKTYTALKEEEGLCRAQIMALKWQEFNEQQSVKQKELQELALRHEQQNSVLTHINTQKTLLKEQEHEASAHSQEIQSLFYQLGTEVARLEETIQQQQREKKRLETDRQQMQVDWQSAKERVKQDQEQLLLQQQSAQELGQRVEQKKLELNEKEQQWQEGQKQQTMQEAQWQEVQNKRNTINSELQVAKVKLQHIEQRYQQHTLRLEKIQVDKSSISIVDIQEAKLHLDAQHLELKESLRWDEEQLKIAQDRSNQLRAQLQETEKQLHQLQNDFHARNSEYAALLAAQKAARQSTKRSQETIKEWSNKPRLIELLRVDSEWQFACECVLRDELHAYVLDDFSDLLLQWQDCQRLSENVVTLKQANSATSNRPKLTDKIQGSVPISAYALEHIYAAQHSEEAISWLPSLLEHESVITVDGFWLGKGWVKSINAVEHDELGLLARQQKIAELSLVVEELQQKIALAQTQRDSHYNGVQEALKTCEQVQLKVTSSAEALRECLVSCNKKEQELIHTEHLISTLANQAEDLEQSLEETIEERLQLSDLVRDLEQAFKEMDHQYVSFNDEKQKQQTWVTSLREQFEAVRTHLHQIELECDRALTKTQQIEDRIQREQERLVILEERLEHLALLCMQSTAPELELREKLAEHLFKKSEVELQLTMSREQLSQIKIQLDDFDRDSLKHDLALKETQNLISETRMQEQALAVRASAVQESLDELGLRAPILLEQVPEGVSISLREDELIAITEKIKRLGAINLAAIEEFSTEQQRKLYLDEQYDDLSQALATLQTAIDTMDKETRMRLENTFDEVNTAFKALFPRLFGGGRAQLELTCDNLLEAGIVVMAQPPGKRNSTIHLLSGGEKAMTAVALVFAIFQLNPSPFCMLDEVDAPLDDVNVGRFCDLVKEMSQFVQFLFITHNKVTMELADHLIGVTMREPGVSRLVTVDVKEALTME